MSVAGDIADKIVTAIQGIGLVVSSGPTVTLNNSNVLKRKRPELAEKENPPMIFVVVGENPETEPISATLKLLKWQVAVVIVSPGGMKLEDDERARGWLDQIEAAVYDKQNTTFSSLSTFNTCDVRGRTPFDPTAMDKGLSYLTTNFTVETLHTLAT